MHRIAINNLKYAVPVLSGSFALCDDKPPNGKDKDTDSYLRAAILPFVEKEAEMRKRWEDDEETGFRKLPARAWPAYQPSPEQLPVLEKNVECECGSNTSTNNNFKCQQAIFDLASCLVFNTLDAPKGLKYYEEQSAVGHIDSTVAAGIMLVEGLGVPANEQAGVNYLYDASKKGSAQGLYELGTAVYTGVTDSLVVSPELAIAALIDDGRCSDASRWIKKIAGISYDADTYKTKDIDIDTDAQAYIYFNHASKQKHVGSMFMAGDMLLLGEAGVGVELGKDKYAEAVALVYEAAEKGHRYGRQRIRSLLDNMK